jgi:hypothetical protein
MGRLLSDDLRQYALAPATIDLGVEDLLTLRTIAAAFDRGNDYFAPRDLEFCVHAGEPASSRQCWLAGVYGAIFSGL